MMEYFNTFGGNPVACAVGLEVLAVIRDEGLQENAAEVGGYVMTQLEQLKSVHPRVGDVRGKGLLFGVEFVEDKTTRQPDALTAAYVMQRMKSQGVLVSTDGPERNVAKMKPPLCFTKTDADTLVAAMDFALRERDGLGGSLLPSAPAAVAVGEKAPVRAGRGAAPALSPSSSASAPSAASTSAVKAGRGAVTAGAGAVAKPVAARKAPAAVPAARGKPAPSLWQLYQ